MASSGNFSTMNPLHKTSTNVQYSNGNLTFSPNSSWSETTFTRNTMVIPKDKKIYFEVHVDNQNGDYFMWGFSAIKALPTTAQSGGTGTIMMYNGSTRINGTRTDGVGTSFSQGAIVQAAIDGSNNKVWFGVNNTWEISGDPANGTNEIGTITTNDTVGYDITAVFNQNSASILTVNFGQDSTFGGQVSAGGNADDNGFGDFKYAPPSGFLALCSANLSIDSDIDPAATSTDFPQKQFNAITYTGNSSPRSITGLGFQPDVVWFQRRDYTGSYNQGIIDSSRGASLGLYPDRTNADTDFGTSDFTSFDSDGFSLKAGGSANINNNTSTFVAWCWRANGGTTVSNSNGAITSNVQANQAAGFSIVKWTANATSSVATTVGHGLSKAPEFVITKSRDSAGNWCVTHTGLSSTSHMLFLNTNAVESDKSGNGSMSANTSTVFSVNATDGSNSPNGDNMIAYCWHSVEGYSKFGGYTGNQDTDGNFIYTGFRPRLLAIRNLGTAGDGWRVYDSARETANVMNLSLSWNNSNIESTGTANNLDFLSNGFKLRAANPTINWGSSYGPYIYMAWGDVPFKYNNAF